MERFALILLQVPHGFQQALLAEKTLTLSYAIPSFHAMRMYWTAQKETMPHASMVIDAGLEKLAQYVASMSVVLHTPWRQVRFTYLYMYLTNHICSSQPGNETRLVCNLLTSGCAQD